MAIKKMTGKAKSVKQQGKSRVSRLGTLASKQAEEISRRELELSEIIINTTQQIVLLLDTQGCIVRFNRFMEDLAGWRLDEVKGKDWFDTFLPGGDRDQIRGLYAQALNGKRTSANVNPIMTRDGRRRDIEWYDAPLTDADGKLLGLLCTGVDITEQKELQKQVLEAAAEEDRRIGQELHDGIQQEVTGLELFATSLLRELDRLKYSDLSEAGLRVIDEAKFLAIRNITEKICLGLAGTQQHIQVLSRGIMPVQIDAQGLNAALRELAVSTQVQTAFRCTYWSPEVIEVTDNTAATHLYRIAQEAINNALRHSQGDTIGIALFQDNNHLSLEVHDNGIGFEPAADGRNTKNGGGIGLHSMQYRASLIGGRLQIMCGEDGGTVVRCTLLKV